MSDKTFQLTCKAPMPGVSLVMTISPLLPQATVVVSNAEESAEALWNLTKVSPTSLVIEEGEMQVSIQRSTGKVSYEVPSTYTSIPPKSELECDAPQSL